LKSSTELKIVARRRREQLDFEVVAGGKYPLADSVEGDRDDPGLTAAEVDRPAADDLCPSVVLPQWATGRPTVRRRPQ